ncbi:MAG: hypothetical protein NTY48_07330 [Candidatus Diapherotrites archaeon]|nr:hypothetical protein [Candidatus Diapherotrites archaeon]
MKKLCARCGIIFESTEMNPKFCSTRCQKMMGESSLPYVKKGQTERKVYAPEM